MPASVCKKLSILEKYLMLVKCSKNRVGLKCVCQQGAFSHIILVFLRSATDEEGVWVAVQTLTVTCIEELLHSRKKHFLHLELAALHSMCNDLHLHPSLIPSYPDCELGTVVHLLYRKPVQFKYSLGVWAIPSNHTNLDVLVLIAPFSAAEERLTSPAVTPACALGINDVTFSA